MRLHRRAVGFTALLAGPLVAATTSLASPGGYASRALFEANVSGAVAVADAEGLASGNVVSGTTWVPPGASAGIVLPGPVVDVLDPAGSPLELQVVTNAGDNPARSGQNSLGSVDPGNFDAIASGTVLGFGFTQPVEAFGLTLITPEEPGGALFDGDVRLTVPGEPTAHLSLAGGQSVGSFNGREYRAYFLGVVAGSPFAAASLEYAGSTPVGGFFFNVDDMTIPVPEPGGAPMLAAGVAWLVWRTRARTFRHREHGRGDERR